MIDFHAHIYPDHLAKNIDEKLRLFPFITPATDGTHADTIRYFKENGVDKFVALNIATKEKQHKNVNDFAISLDSEPDIVSFGSVYPTSDSFEPELLRLKAAGIKGVKFHPEYQDFEIDDPRAFRVYEMCRDLDFVISFHAGRDLAYPHRLNCPADKALNVVKNFPKNKLVFAHFGGYRIFPAVFEYLAGQNCYFDTSFISLDDIEFLAVLNAIAKKHGASKLLFGSDTPWMHIKRSIELIDSLDLSSSEKQLIFDGNARELLQLE